MRIIDISQRVHSEMLVYPGDPKYVSETVSSFRDGDGYEVSRLVIGSHCGTHIDSPSHMLAGGDTIDQLPLDAFYGPCRVITASAEDISEKMIISMAVKPGERILLKTDPQAKYGTERFNPSAISLSGARRLAEQKPLLIGIDAPSVENVEEHAGEIHRTLLSAGIVLLEGLCLSHVPDGAYMLSAFPLSLLGENGSPCRAVLIKNEG